MSTAPSIIANPFDLLICDTDALVQLFCGGQSSLLRRLKIDYGIDCVVVEAVEAEIMRPGRKHAGCCQAGFKKALETGLLTVLDRTTMSLFTRNDPSATYDSIQLRGQQNIRIGRGEAFTHAAASVLKAAVLSNDANAVRTAQGAGYLLGDPVLRAYDLIVLFFQRGHLSESDCDDFRKALVAANDGPHSEFAGRKFAQGVTCFYPRLVDIDHPAIGSSYERELGDERRVKIKSTR